MHIRERAISRSHPPYIIAELGVNHDGNIDRALELTHAAASAGADAVKLQYFETDRLMSRAAKLAAYQRAAGEADPISMLRRLELPLDAMSRVVDLAHDLGLHAIVTVFSVELIERAQRLAWDAYKVASPDIVHLPLLKALATTDRPLILSTGAATTDEILAAYVALSDADDRLAFMQCVSSYPTPIERASIGAIAALESLTACPIGYSDHTSSEHTGALARQFGAVMLEKHLTYDTSAKGPDHAASLDPQSFSHYVRLAHNTPMLLPHERAEALADTERLPPGVGAPHKHVLDIEHDVRRVSRQSVTLSRDIPAGHALSHRDLTIKRPATGIPAARFEYIIGAIATRALPADSPLTDDMIRLPSESFRQAG